MGDLLSDNADLGSFVVYRSPTGESYHSRATCATDAGVPPQLDMAESVLEGVEMYRVREVQEELDGGENLCDNCAAEIARALRSS